MQKLTESQITKHLGALPEWSIAGDAIQRTYQFDTFVQSIKFVNTVAAAAEQAQHHPDIIVRYNKVTLTLSTHDAGGITKKDFDFARKADSIGGYKLESPA